MRFLKIYLIGYFILLFGAGLALWQKRLAGALADGATGRVKIPNEFARQCVMHAYLGVLDVQPLDNPGGSRGSLTRCEFWAESVDQILAALLPRLRLAG